MLYSTSLSIVSREDCSDYPISSKSLLLFHFNSIIISILSECFQDLSFDGSVQDGYTNDNT